MKQRRDNLLIERNQEENGTYVISGTVRTGDTEEYAGISFRIPDDPEGFERVTHYYHLMRDEIGVLLHRISLEVDKLKGDPEGNPPTEHDTETI